MKTYELDSIPCYFLVELSTLSELSYSLYATKPVDGERDSEIINLLDIEVREAKVIMLEPWLAIAIDNVVVTIRKEEYLKALGRKKLNESEKEILSRFKVLVKAIRDDNKRCD